MIVAIGSLIAGISGIVSAVLLYRKTVALLEYRMELVEKRLDEHNGYAKKFGDITGMVAEIKTDIAVIKNEISHIKNGD